jgi:hypothetical protein
VTESPVQRIAGIGGKDGSGNVAIWTRTEQAWSRLVQTLTVAELRRLVRGVGGADQEARLTDWHGCLQ